MVCGYHGNAQSLSYNYMGKNGSRTFTPRYTPAPFASLFPPTLIVRPLSRHPFFHPRVLLPSLHFLLLSPAFYYSFLSPLFLSPPRNSTFLLLSASLILTSASPPRLIEPCHLPTFARLGNIMLAPRRGDCVTILNSL